MRPEKQPYLQPSALNKITVIICILFTFHLATGQNKDKTYILVHGAWHGAWCWHKVLPKMTSKGYDVMAIDLPGHGLDRTNPEIVSFRMYVDKVKETALSTKNNVILVGHSMAGTIIAQAAEELGVHKVSKLIFVDAFLPKNGESVSSLARLLESEPPNNQAKINIGQGLIVNENRTTASFKKDVADILFYHDCSRKDKEFAHNNLSVQPLAPLGEPVKVTNEIYGKIPKYYILCTESKDLNKKLLPARVPCEKVISIRTSHSPFFSKPGKLAKLLMDM
jgi:pimeloyl-ACP methyl ester carboxylesterase